MTALMNSLEQRHPDVRSVMAAALGNVVPTHLLDRNLLVRLLAHDGSGGDRPPKDERTLAPPRVQHASALPVRSGQRRLPLI